MAEQKTIKVDKEELNRANELWAGFTEATKWTVIATSVVLILMAIFLL